MRTEILRRRIYDLDYFSYRANVGIDRQWTGGRWLDSSSLLAGATLILVIQLFPLLFSGDETMI
jgi:hypothetical protein